MLELQEIEKFYPEPLRRHKRFLLREYLQCKILQILFESEYASKFSFLGGTCLRIVHGNNRFSEDLDFDNFQLEEKSFEQVGSRIEKELSREGYSVEMKTVLKGAYHCHIRFPEILYREGLSGHMEEKILIQLDTQPQNFPFKPDRFLLNRFDIFTQILVTPKELLLAQKFYAVLNRKRSQGRDFFDLVFLLSLTDRPDYGFLDMKLGITHPDVLKTAILEKCNTIDMEKMARDVTPFLFRHEDVKKVSQFVPYLKQFPLK
ncbi:MAG TPA: nucleotidyl transferase AbiEii/AbiGii toxin family protein [Chitinophagaceae bacterium]|nr:nucleotidyl transferase AbiEii/AbiGii toxin family protein [Chitinophagaceae bacterium]